ncbi:histone-lysine N-methyltransferase set-1-like [Mercenaria mercenaria]|uniref:histone-lysine N-methyltransferase set-1-like n=1 Tax=Mercenaria mercenaria TaxID=6596 RepID=UPI00234EDFBE|nr:histone-lysine N-methyltransferase set-1-like [Mercenaria mercenaria]
MNPYCLLGSADGCDVIVKDTIPTHFQIEFNSEKQAFLRCFKPVTLDGQVVSGVALLPDVAVILINGKEFQFLKQVLRTEKRIKPVEEALRFVLGQHDPEDICEKYINDFIGRGVFAKKIIRNGKFLAEYHGVLSKADDVKDKDTNYTYFFDFNGVKYCFDASEEPKLYQPSLGRLINHADKKTTEKFKNNSHWCEWGSSSCTVCD